MKRTITESQLKKMITESIYSVLKEQQGNTITIGSPEDGNGLHVTIACDSLGPYAEFDVYGVGSDAGAALDGAVDYLEENGEIGYFCDDDEIAQEYPDDYITCGNHCHLLRRDLVHIQPIKNMNESSINEYQIGDFTKRIGAGLSTFSGKKGSISQKLHNAKKNFQTQGEINDLNELLMKLQKYVDMKMFSPNQTIAELIGNKWMIRGDKQGIKQRAGGLRGNIKQRGGQWH